MKRMKRLLTPRQVARMLGFKPRTISRWCREGIFPSAFKVGRVWRIPEDDLFIKTMRELESRADG